MKVTAFPISSPSDVVTGCNIVFRHDIICASCCIGGRSRRKLQDFLCNSPQVCEMCSRSVSIHAQPYDDYPKLDTGRSIDVHNKADLWRLSPTHGCELCYGKNIVSTRALTVEVVRASIVDSSVT